MVPGQQVLLDSRSTEDAVGENRLDQKLLSVFTSAQDGETRFIFPHEKKNLR